MSELICPNCGGNTVRNTILNVRDARGITGIAEIYTCAGDPTDSNRDSCGMSFRVIKRGIEDPDPVSSGFKIKEVGTHESN